MAVDTIDRLDLLLSQFAKSLGVLGAFGKGELFDLGANLNEFSFKSIGSVEFTLVLLKGLSLDRVGYCAFKSIGKERTVGDRVLVAIGVTGIIIVRLESLGERNDLSVLIVSDEVGGLHLIFGVSCLLCCLVDHSLHRLHIVSLNGRLVCVVSILLQSLLLGNPLSII